MDSLRISAVIRILAIAVVGAFGLSAVPYASFDAAAAEYTFDSDSTHWSSYWPRTSAVLNQTIGDTGINRDTQVELAANIWGINKDSSAGRIGMRISTATAASCRNQMAYTMGGQVSSSDFSYFNARVQSTPLRSTIGDDGGVWVNVGEANDLWQPTDLLNYKNHHLVFYFGDYYEWVYISSNGFIVLSNKKIDPVPSTWKSKTVPSTAPSSAAPNSIVAPYWRDMDPTKAVSGAGVKYGIVDDKFVVIWDRLPNYGKTQTQSFGLYFNFHEKSVAIGGGVIHPDDLPTQNIRFFYGSIDRNDNVPTKVFLEDQSGTRGNYVGTASSIASATNAAVDFVSNILTRQAITKLSFNVDKFKKDASGEWIPDTSSTLYVLGPTGSSEIGGINLALTGNPTYKSYANKGTWIAAADWLVSLGQMVSPSSGISAVIGAFGYSVSSSDFANQLVTQVTPVGNTWTWDAEGDLSATYLALDYNLTSHYNHWGLNCAWDVALAPQFIWEIPEASSLSVARKVQITSTATYQYFWIDWKQLTGNWEVSFGPEYRVHACIDRVLYDTYYDQGIEVRPDGLTPSGVEWMGRTVPDGNYYQCYPISTTYSRDGIGYEIRGGGAGSSSASYDIVSWNVTNTDKVKVRPDGSIRIEGWFKQNDPYSDTRRSASIYVMYMKDGSGKFTPAKTAQVLSQADGTSWKFKSIQITGLTPGELVKIGVAKTVHSSASTSLSWAGLRTYCQETVNGVVFWALSISTGTGVTTNPGSTDGTYSRILSSQTTVTATPSSGSNRVAYWMDNGKAYLAKTDGSYIVPADKDHAVTPYVVSSTAKVLIIRWYMNGGTTPTAGVYSYASGASVTVQASPISGYKFTYWSLEWTSPTAGSSTSLTNPITLSMSKDYVLTPHFALKNGPTPI